MGDLTRANKQRISHRLDAGAARRRNAELVFTAVILVVMSFLAGYFVGSTYPYSRTVPDYAKKVGEVREKATRAAPAPGRSR